MIPIKDCYVEDYSVRIKEFIDKYSRKIKTNDIEKEMQKFDSSINLKSFYHLIVRS